MTILELLAAIGQNKDNQELLTGLAALNLVATKEITKEVEAKYTDNGVMEYLAKSQPLTDKIYNENTKKFLAKKLGKDVKDIKDEDMGLELITKDSLTEQTGKYEGRIKEYEISRALGDKADLLKPHLDMNKIIIGEDFTVKGLDEQVIGLKTKFAPLFEVKEGEEKKPGGTGQKGAGALTLQEQLKEAERKAMETGSMADRANYQALKTQVENGGKE
ncbi:hypothetical protein [Fusobacterium varium]|uniref:hypothetical protein n=1 Tax=Fusobacterium varium TaxID=856 RepID=UPI003567C1EF